MKNVIDKYSIVLDEMPNEFSTNMFIDELRKLGVGERTIESQHHIGFLIVHCDRVSNRLFRKKTTKQFNEKAIIEFLTLNGYKKDYNRKILLAELHNEYLSYCQKNDTTPFFIRDFNKKLTELGFLCKRYGEGICVHVANSSTKNNSEITIESAIDSAINLLKSKGFKILKPITEYQEL